MMRVQCRPEDAARAARLVLAWLTDDRPAVDLAADEMKDDPEKVAGTMFAMVDLAAQAANLADPDGAVGNLRAYVLDVALAAGGPHA